MKRILICAMAVLLLIPLMVFPALASEVYTFVPAEIPLFGTCPAELPEGKYIMSGSFYIGESQITATADAPVDISYGPIDDDNISLEKGCIFEVSATFNLGTEVDQGSALCIVGFADDIPGTSMAVLLGEENFFSASNAVVNLTPVESTSNKAFLSSVTDGLTTSIRWCGSVISSLVSGELSPLLPLMAISVSIAALFLGCKVIKKYTWGA